MEENNSNHFEWLFSWFYKQCDDDWEHGKGIQNGTLSNPGWYIKIDIEDTEVQNKNFKKVFINRSENDWIFCEKKDYLFVGDCGPFNLSEVLQIFKN